MHYFTPELFVRLQDLRDEAALQAWDRASAAYASSLEGTLPTLPRDLRRVGKGLTLHDADVLTITRSSDVLSITVQPDLPGAGLLILSYTLVESPRVERSVFPREHGTEHAAWLYDELALAEPSAGPPSWQTAQDRARGDGRVTVYTHDILLSNGWEVLLKFRRFRLGAPETLLPVARLDEEREEALPRSA
jgi:hypothetical protein